MSWQSTRWSDVARRDTHMLLYSCHSPRRLNRRCSRLRRSCAGAGDSVDHDNDELDVAAGLRGVRARAAAIASIAVPVRGRRGADRGRLGALVSLPVDPCSRHRMLDGVPIDPACFGDDARTERI